MELFGHEKKKVIWEVVDNHVVEETLFPTIIKGNCSKHHYY